MHSIAAQIAAHDLKARGVPAGDAEVLTGEEAERSEDRTDAAAPSGAADPAPEKRGPGRPRGRKDKAGQEKVLAPDIAAGELAYLCDKYRAMVSTRDAFSEQLASVSEKSGFLAAALRKVVIAKCGRPEDYADEKRKANQLAFAFNELENADAE